MISSLHSLENSVSSMAKNHLTLHSYWIYFKGEKPIGHRDILQLLPCQVLWKSMVANVLREYGTKRERVMSRLIFLDGAFGYFDIYIFI